MAAFTRAAEGVGSMAHARIFACTSRGSEPMRCMVLVSQRWRFCAGSIGVEITLSVLGERKVAADATQ